MARYDDTKEALREMREARRIEPFFKPGIRNQLVKVLPRAAALPQEGVRGYVTQQGFIENMTPQEIGLALGMRETDVKDGCRVVKLLYPPGPSIVVYELTTRFPNGLVYDPTFKPEYRAGNKNYIHQWRILTNVPAVLPGRVLGRDDKFILIT